MKIVVANSVGRLDTGQELILFPSRWDSAVTGRRPFAYYPYELAYLSSLLKRETDHDVKMLDGNLDLLNADQYAQRIIDERPHILVTECSALTYPAMTRCAQTVWEETGCQRWLCGPLGTYDSGQARADGWDAAFRGEYETSVLDGLRTFREGRIRITSPYVDLDTLPWPEDDDISRIDYDEASNPCDGLVQLYPTRGCPLACTFCVVPLYYGGHGNSHKSHRTRDPENVCDEIDYLADRYPGQFNGCFFNEEAHSADPVWLEKFCRTLIRRRLNEWEYDAMCGMWSFTEELVNLCAEAGYTQLRFGVESTSEQVGKAIHKSLHLEKMEAFLGWCKAAGIDAYGTFQIGCEGSSEAIDRRTLEDLRRWVDDGLMQRWQVSTSTPQVGTPFYQRAKDSGWLVTEDLEKFDGFNAVVDFPYYRADRIQAVRALA